MRRRHLPNETSFSPSRGNARAGPRVLSLCPRLLAGADGLSDETKHHEESGIRAGRSDCLDKDNIADVSTAAFAAAAPVPRLFETEDDAFGGRPPNVTPVDDRTIDDHLIDRTLRGESVAFGELVGRYQDRLRVSLCRLTNSVEESEDVAQEAFVQAYLKLSSFQRSSRFYTWIYRIAFNLAISKNRKRRPRVSLSAVQEAGGADPIAESDCPTAGAFADERSRLLHEAIAELADDHRQVLVLREFEDMDYQQIADLIDAPIGTVRSRLFRARAQLRERLGGILGEEG